MRLGGGQIKPLPDSGSENHIPRKIGGHMSEFPDDLSKALVKVGYELKNAMDKFPPMHSAHEGFSILKEEVDELWDEVKTQQSKHDFRKMEAEAIQVAAMAVRFMIDVCGRSK